MQLPLLGFPAACCSPLYLAAFTGALQGTFDWSGNEVSAGG